MKSIKSEGSATCPNCGEVFDAEFWTLVSASDDEALKQSLLGGELNLVSCPSCGKFFYHDRNIIYFDPPAELLAFVSPDGDKNDFEKIKQKMQTDFQTLKANITSLNIDYEPFYLCGLAELKAMADYETSITEESEVLAVLCAQMGYKLAAIKKSAARVKGWPFYLPVDGDNYTKDAVLKAARQVIAANPNMHLLAAFVKDIRAGAELPQRL